MKNPLVELLWRTECLLKKLFNLVDVCLDLSFEGQERRVRPWSQVVQICRLPAEDTRGESKMS